MSSSDERYKGIKRPASPDEVCVFYWQYLSDFSLKRTKLALCFFSQVVLKCCLHAHSNISRAWYDFSTYL